MGSVISKTANSSGVYRYIDRVDETKFSTDDWERNPDISGVQGVRKRFWKYDGTNVVVEQDYVAKVAIENATNVPVNEFGLVQMCHRGNIAKGRWLRQGSGLMLTSNRQPHLFLNEGVVSGLTYSNYYANSGCDIELYINKKKAFTWEIRDLQYAHKTTDLSALQFKTGDMLSAYARLTENKRASWVMVNIEYRYSILTTGEGGAATV